MSDKWFSLNEDQRNDLEIIMSLKNSLEIQEWMDAVGPADVKYGMAIMQVAALDELDQSEIDFKVMLKVEKMLYRIGKQSRGVK